ncbi:hypothetical protein HJD18_13010 [Thermoleophilia bacterium SCSIO 60948]|nr:hypothetical protein HJD18_13010 [Thermoleophilia bacterium SCSIO 60948]
MFRGSVTRRIAATLAIAFGCLALPAAASAEFAPTNVQVTPDSTQAGSNSDLRIQFTFSDPDEQVKDLIVGLPPGLIGNPTVPETCSAAQLNSDACPAASQVGTVTTGVTAYPTDPLPVPVPLSVDGSIYNFTPQAGEPARFGIVLRPVGGLLGKITLQSGVGLRDDFGLDTILTNLPTESNGLRTDITSMDLTLNGSVHGGGFIRKPTSCAAHSVRVTANSYDSPEPRAATASFATTGCDQLEFTPEFAAFAKTEGPDDRTVETTTQIKQTLEEAGLRTAKVILPPAFGPNTARLLPQNSCGEDAFEQGDCPARSRVGGAVAETPVLDESISGDVFVVDPDPEADPDVTSGQPRLGLDLRGPLNLRLLGQFIIQLEPRIGVGVVFDDLPDIPISNFELTFDGGPNGLNTTAEDICGPQPPVFDLTFDSYSGDRETFSQDAETECGGGPPVGRSKARARLTDAKRPALQLGARDRAGIKRATFAMPKRLRFTKERSAVRARTGNGRPAKFALSKRAIIVRATDARSLRVRVKNSGLRLKGSPGKIRGKRVTVTIRRDGGGTTSLKAPIR